MRAILFAIGQAFSSFWKRSFITLLSITTITIALIILGAFAIVTLNLRSALGSLKRQVQLEFYLVKGTTKPTALPLIEKLEKEEHVESVEFITAECARKEFIDEFGEELLRGLPGNPFPPSLRISFENALSMDEEIARIAEKYKGDPIVADLSSPNRIAYKLAKASKIFLVLTISWGIVLLIAATLIITNTIRLAIAQRTESIKIMRLVGASKSFVRLPFLFEGVLHGAISGGLAWLAIGGLTSASRFIVHDIYPLPVPILILIVVFGAIFGGLGSNIAIRRHLKY